jgi:hypothetical protein
MRDQVSRHRRVVRREDPLRTRRSQCASAFDASRTRPPPPPLPGPPISVEPEHLAWAREKFQEVWDVFRHSDSMTLRSASENAQLFRRVAEAEQHVSVPHRMGCNHCERGSLT